MIVMGKDCHQIPTVSSLGTVHGSERSAGIEDFYTVVGSARRAA
jgi:hypothetical protein